MLDRRQLLFAGGAALVGGVLLGIDQDEPKPAACDPSDPNCPMPCGPDGCPVNIYRGVQTAAGMPVTAYTGVVLDLPPELRMKNYSGGSCVWASCETVLRWMGQFEMADYFRQQYHGGENDTRLIARLEAAGLKYCWSSEPSFFDWCQRTRRGCGIFYRPSHSITWVGKDATYDYILDNNDVNYPETHGHYDRVEHNAFIKAWHGYGSFAWSFIYDPAAGTPTY